MNGRQKLVLVVGVLLLILNFTFPYSQYHFEGTEDGKYVYRDGQGLAPIWKVLDSKHHDSAAVLWPQVMLHVAGIVALCGAGCYLLRTREGDSSKQ